MVVIAIICVATWLNIEGERESEKGAHIHNSALLKLIHNFGRGEGVLSLLPYRAYVYVYIYIYEISFFLLLLLFLQSRCFTRYYTPYIQSRWNGNMDFDGVEVL